MLFRDPDQSTQRVVQAIAHNLDLEYEFSLATRYARVTRPTRFHPAYDAVAQLPQSFTSGQQAHIGDPSLSSNFWDDSLGIDQSFPPMNDGGGCPSLDLYSWLQDSGPTIDNVTGAFKVPDITGQAESIQPADGSQEQLRRASPSHQAEPPRGSPSLETENRIFGLDVPRPNSPPLGPIRGNSGSSPPSSPILGVARRTSPRPGPGDAVLLSFMDDGSNVSDGNIATGSRSHVSNGYSSDRAGRSSSKRAPLSTIARASSRAVKALGACWRCRVLRDKVFRTFP
jgi:hypothetical protein